MLKGVTINNMGRALRGVNLGGWLLLERWITPSLFGGTDALDEFSFMKTTGARNKLERHRNEFITEADFIWMQQNGIQAVRLPVGYWVLKDDPPFVGAGKYLDFAVRMCEKYQLKLLIDLHGAPGSQNGKDHSGRIGTARWRRDRQCQQAGIEVLIEIAKRYRDSPAIWGYQVLNEPIPGLFQWRLRRYYQVAYRELSRILRPGVRIIYHDGFTSLLMSGAIRPYGSHPVVMDRHWYHFLQLGFRHLPVKYYFWKLRSSTPYLKLVNRLQPLVIGEWSGVLAGSTLKGLEQSQRRQLQTRHLNDQLKLYDSLEAWFYWSYKTEGGGFWSFRHLVERGVIKLDTNLLI